MATQHNTKQRLALAICDFLAQSAADGSLSTDDKESVEIASGLIAECFRVNPADKAAVQDAVAGQNLLGIYSVYEKMRGAAEASKDGSSSSSSNNNDSNKTSDAQGAGGKAAPTEAQIAEAESLKSRGNAAMAAKDYPLAISLYTDALALRPAWAVYLSNRAAAHSASRDHSAARNDAEAAVAADPTYTKGWSRLGLARFALGDARGAMEAYGRGIEAEGNGGSEVMRKGFETARKRVDELDGDAAASRAPAAGAGGDGGGLGSLASLLGNAGGGGGGAGGGGGGGFDGLASLMQNPMFANMAQNLMSNPDMMSNLMSNPRLREMAERFGGGGGGGGGGGMPDLASLMSDPNVAEMAKMFGGGGGSGAGAGRGGAPQ